MSTLDHESCDAAEFPGSHDVVLWVEMPPARPHRSCNRHYDCDAAEIKRFGATGYYANFHCHDDECEDCFGK